MFQGERNDIIIDFSKLPVGTTVKLLNKAPEAVGTRMEEVMLFEVVRTAVDDSQVPTTLATWEVLTKAMATPGLPTRYFNFGRTNGFYDINSKIWDKNRFDATPRLGTTEIWRFENNSGGWFHPIHVHLVDFQVIYRKTTNGQPYAWEKGRKDVVALGEGEVVDVVIKWDAAKYQNFTGPYMIHCHNVDHEDHDMMTQYNLLPA
jgi:FtsP/CotA-like multicopper oxidase with cupredoxin domain